MSYGRAMLLGLALASAVAARLAIDSIEADRGASLVDAAGGGPDHPAGGPAAPAVPPTIAAVAAVWTAGPLIATAPCAATRPIVVSLRIAPKTSPPAA